MNIKVIDRFFKGNCSDKEAIEFIHWIKTREGKNKLVGYIRENWQANQYIMDKNYDEKALLARINKKIDQDYPEIKSNRVALLNFKLFRYVAILTLFVIFSYLMISNEDFYEESETIILTKRTEPGQKLKFKLPDNSFVILNADSQIDYLENDTVRSIKLIGEGYFEVVQNNQKPFVVHSGKISTTAIGTEFNVLYRKNLDKAVVSLIDGKVNIRSVAKSVHLIPGEQAVINNKTFEIEKTNWEYFDVFGWKEGILQFNNARFQKVIEELELWYGIKINIINSENNNSSKHYSGRFDNEPLMNVLESLSFIYDFNYEINGKVIKIKFFKT